MESVIDSLCFITFGFTPEELERLRAMVPEIEQQLGCDSGTYTFADDGVTGTIRGPKGDTILAFMMKTSQTFKVGLILTGSDEWEFTPEQAAICHHLVVAPTAARHWSQEEAVALMTASEAGQTHAPDERWHVGCDERGRIWVQASDRARLEALAAHLHEYFQLKSALVNFLYQSVSRVPAASA
jgi:hypothetical protein